MSDWALMLAVVLVMVVASAFLDMTGLAYLLVWFFVTQFCFVMAWIRAREEAADE